MSRADRLLELMEVLRERRYAVPGAVLARELGVSLRSLYRDIASLRARGARIDGEAGLGYLLRPGFTLPPLNFTEEEVEALVLGCRWVEGRTDALLARAASRALAKIGSALPSVRRSEVEDSGLRVPPPEAAASGPDPALLRRAIRQERRLFLRYRDEDRRTTERVVWPVALGYFERHRVLAAWCETRRDFRHFRTDRIRAARLLEDRYPRRRSMLLREWLDRQSPGQRPRKAGGPGSRQKTHGTAAKADQRGKSTGRPAV